jgi:hypothetical protein
MIIQGGPTPVVIPFEKGGKRHSLNSFLTWAVAGDVHLDLLDDLTAALLSMSTARVSPVLRKRGRVTITDNENLELFDKSEVDNLIKAERRKWLKTQVIEL